MKSPKFLLTAAMAVLLFSSCKKSDTANTTSSMQVQLAVSNPLVTVNKTQAPGTISWNSGSAYTTQVKLEAKQNGGQLEFKTTGARQVDLFAPVATTLGNITVPAGTYSQIEFKISLAPNGNTPAMTLNGQYTNGTNNVIPVSFILNSLIDVKAEQNNVTVSSNSSMTALTTLDLSFVSAGITQAMLDNATLSGGTIIISAASNNNLYNMMVNNLLQFHHVDVSHH